MENIVQNDECREFLLPNDRPSKLYSCSGIVSKYFKKGPGASKETLKTSLRSTLKKGKVKSVVTITDHGAKISPECGDSDYKCMQNKLSRQSYSSIGKDKIGEADLRKLIQEMREEQKKELCENSQEICPLPPLIFNFDHCYSGGMLRGITNEDGSPMENVCGLSASGPNEYAYVGENIAKAINELNAGVRGLRSSEFMKYDLDQDRQFSLNEIYHYLYKKTKRSVPLKSSDVFLLDQYEKQNGPVDDGRSCSLVDEKFFKELDQIEGLVTYKKDFDQFRNLALESMPKAKEMTQKEIDQIIDQEKDAYKLMFQHDEQETLTYNKLENFVKDLKENSYKDVTEQDKIIASDIEKFAEQKKLFCQKNLICQKMNQELEELENNLMGNNDSKMFDVLASKVNKLYDKNKRFFEDKMKENPCDEDCSLLREKKKKMDDDVFKKDEIEKKLFGEDKHKLIASNREQIEKFFQEMKSIVSPYKNQNVQSFFNSEKEKYLKDGFLFKKNPDDFLGALTQFQKQLSTKIRNIQNFSHQNYIQSRKAINQLKMSTALEGLIKSGNQEKLRQYDALKKCEQTTVFNY
jgi:hypothetical protein